MMTETEIDRAMEFLQALKTAETSGRPYCVQYLRSEGWCDQPTCCMATLNFAWEWRIAYKPRECWVNHYPEGYYHPGGYLGQAYKTLAEAGQGKGPDCIGSVHYIEADDTPTNYVTRK